MNEQNRAVANPFLVWRINKTVGCCTWECALYQHVSFISAQLVLLYPEPTIDFEAFLAYKVDQSLVHISTIKYRVQSRPSLHQSF